MSAIFSSHFPGIRQADAGAQRFPCRSGPAGEGKLWENCWSDSAARWLAVPAPFGMMRAAAGRPSPGLAPVGAPVAELVDAPDSKSGGFTSVLVRFRPGAPTHLCKITMTTPTPRVPWNPHQAPRPAIDDAETASAAMRSRLDLQRLERSGSPAHFLNRSGSNLFPNHV